MKFVENDDISITSILEFNCESNFCTSAALLSINGKTQFFGMTNNYKNDIINLSYLLFTDYSGDITYKAHVEEMILILTQGGLSMYLMNIFLLTKLIL